MKQETSTFIVTSSWLGIKGSFLRIIHMKTYLTISSNSKMKRLRPKLLIKLSKGRRLNIKRVIFFPLIVYSVYLLLDGFMSLFMVGSVI